MMSLAPALPKREGSRLPHPRQGLWSHTVEARDEYKVLAEASQDQRFFLPFLPYCSAFLGQHKPFFAAELEFNV